MSSMSLLVELVILVEEMGGSGTGSKLPSSSLPPGAIKGNNGNTYIPYTDSSGNVRYVLYGSDSDITKIENGKVVTTADPNTIGGGLAVSSLSLGNLGSSVSKDVTGLGNNIVDTAGNVVGGNRKCCIQFSRRNRKCCIQFSRWNRKRSDWACWWSSRYSI